MKKYSEITFVLILWESLYSVVQTHLWFKFFSLQQSFRKEVIKKTQISSKLVEIHIMISGSAYICAKMFRIILLTGTVLSDDLW